MNAEESTGSDKSKKTKPKPRTRRTKSEVPCSQNLTVTVAGDDTDPRTVCSNEDVSVGAASGANYSDIPNEAIRPRSSSRRRAYIIKRPQSAPIFGRVTPRSFPSDELDGADKSSPKTCQGSATSSPDNDTSHAVSTTTSGLSGTFPEPKNDSATKMASSEPKSLVCKQITVPAVPQSASSVICYGRTKPLQKENSVDRKEHVEVSVSETIFIHTIKSNSKIQPRPNFSDAPKTSPLFNGKDGDSVPVDSCAQTNVINSQLYAQVIKPKHAAIEISLDSAQKDLAQSSAGISSFRNDVPIVEKKRTSEDLLQNPTRLKGGDGMSSDSETKRSSHVMRDDTDKTVQCKDALGSHGDCGDGSEVTSYSFGRDNEDDTNPEFGSSQASTGRDLDIPRLKLDSLTRDNSNSSQDSQRSDVNTEERLEYSVDEMYANIDAVQAHSGNVSLVNELSESCVFDTKDKSIADSRLKDPTSTPCMAVKESDPDSIENSLVKTTQTATCESTKPSGKVDTKTTMNLTALHNKSNAKKGKPAEVTPPQQVGLIREKEKKPNTAKADSAASMPVKKLSVEYTDPVELHSSDILQAGGVAHDPHETVSSAWSEDTDSEEAHKVKKRQHNPLKRLFARKKGKYSPSSNTGSSILPTLESEHQNLKKEKSSSPKLFKRKKKVKIFSSESELSPSDEGFSKHSKETKKKTKNAKLTKESIIVIKSSGKSLSDSMPELAKIASTSSGTDNNNTETTLEERPKTSTHGDKDVVHEDNVGNVKNAKQNQSSDISKNNQKRHFYENVALNVSTTKKNKVKTDDNSDEDKAHNENLDPKEKPEFQVLLDNQAKAGSSPEVVDSGGTNMVMAQAKAKVGNTNEESEVAEDVYANSIFQNDSLEAADISIEMDCEYDRPPSKEIRHDSARIFADVINATIENDQELSFAKDVPSSSEPIHDIESRKKMYLYTAKPRSNENEEFKIDKLSADAPSIFKQVGNTEPVSNDQKSTNETSSGGRDKRKALTSIETTDSDNEVDEKLLNAAAAENPLRRPKYAMTRLQAHLSGKPLSNEPVLMESRYADKEEMEEDQEAPLVEIPQPKRKAEKKRKHEDRIEREDISLEDDSVPDTSGFDLSPRSDASSSTATDSDITPSFDAVIQLCDSVQSPPDDQDDGERIYKNAKSLSRSPSQLLIRADVHNALESVSTPDQHDGEGVVDTIDGKGDPLHEDNIKPDEEGNKAKQVRDGTMNKRVDKDIETTQHDGNKIDDEMTDINAENLGENLSSIKKKSEEVMLQRKPDSKILERGTGEKSEAKKNKFQKVNLGKCINAVDKLSVPCSSSNQEPSSSSFDSIKDIDNESPVDVEKCMLLRSNVDEQRETRTLGNESDIPLNGANERCNTSNNDDIEDKFTTEEKTTENFEQQEKKFHVKSNEHDNKIKGISDKKNITEHENKSINCESPLTDGKKSTEGPTYHPKSKTQVNDIAGSCFPSSDDTKPQNNVECVEEVIIPSASKKVECNVFAFSERLQKLDQEDVGSTQEELHKRPPSIKQRPPSWKMKTFLRKFDNVGSSKPTIAPKPQRHRDSARESINSDLLQGAMKELDDFIDTELEDECDESEESPNNTESRKNVSEDSNKSNSPTLPTSTNSGKDKLSKNYDNMKEVVEETIMRSKAKKDKSTPFKNTLMVLDKHGSDKDKVTEGNISVEDKQSACGSSGADDSVQASTGSLSQSVPSGNSSVVGSKILTSVLKDADPSVIPTKALEGRSEDGLENNANENTKTDCIGVNKKDNTCRDNSGLQSDTDAGHTSVSYAKLASPNVIDQDCTVTVGTKENNLEMGGAEERQTGELYPALDSSENVDVCNKTQPSAKPDGPPPIPVKKGKEPHGKDPFLPVLSTKNETVCKDQPVVDLGYEDVLDKVSDDEKSLAKPSDNASTKETNPKTDAKQSSSPGSKRFNFPWRKKSKDKIHKHPRPGVEENQKTANHSKEIDNQDLCSQSKTKQPAVEVAAEKKKRKSPTAVSKIHKEKAAKPQKKKRKDKSDKRSKNPDVKEKNKTKKEKHNPKVTRDVPVEVYHEIEDVPSIGEETNKTKTPSSWKKDITSTSTSASSSPFSSSPLYSSDESDYEPVNYVSGKDIREDMKKRLKAEDSNGYEIPAEKTSAEEQAVSLKDTPVESNSPASPADPKQHPNNKYDEKPTAPLDSTKLVESENIENSFSDKSAKPCEFGLSHSPPQYDSDGEEVIEPYLTFQYPKYLDDGEIYVGNPIAVLPSRPGTLRSHDNSRSDRNDPTSSSSMQKDLENDNRGRNMSEYLNESVNLAKLKTNTDDTVGDDTSEVSTAEDAIDMDGGEQRAPELNATSHQTITGPIGINETKQGADTTAHINKNVAISSSHKDFESPASPSDISSPELAVRSHISETLSKAFQDFDFGFDESGPVSDAEPVTASPPVDKDRVSSIQWEWKDPPESESTHYHEGPLKNMGNVKDSALSPKEQTGHPKSAVESFADREMPLAGIGASVVLSEVKPSLTEGEGGMYDSVHNIDELGTKPEKGEAKSVSSDCSSVTASPPSSPVSDKTLKERSRLGKALAKRQVKSREKSKDKSKPRSAKRDKSKDKLKQKVSKDKDKSKDKKSEKNKSAQLDEANKSQDKANKKESEEKEKEKWKWPWQRRGSKKEVAQVASESDDSEVISKTGSKSKDKKKEKETQSSKPTISPSVSEVQMRHTDQEDILLNEFNPCDDATKSLLESRINNPLEEHDYFNTFLGSSQCFQLPSSIGSYIANQEEENLPEKISGNTFQPDSLLDTYKRPISEEKRNSTFALRQESGIDETREDQNGDAEGKMPAILQVSDTEQNTGHKTSNSEENVQLAKDAPWSLFQLPSFQSSCSLHSEDPWKDYSPLELGKTQINSDTTHKRNPDQPRQTVKTEISKNKNNNDDNDGMSGLEDQKLSSKYGEEQNDILSSTQQQNPEPAILPLSNQIEDSERGTSDKNPAHGSDIGKISNKPLLKPKVACRTISQPLQTRSPPVPRVRTTVRRHRSELAAPGEGFVVELSDLWTSSTSITPGEAESKESEESKENKDSKESRENEESDPATPGLDDTYCNTAQLKGYQNNGTDREDKDGTYVSPFKNNGDNELTPQADKTSSPLELKPKTRRISTTSDNNQDLILTKQIPPKPERKSSTSANSGGRSRKASRDEQSIGTTDARHNSNPDNDEESEVEYDKLPVRHKNIGSRKAFQSFVPSVPVKGVGSERVVYTPVNRSPVQRLRSTEKTEYAAPWEENIQALTPTLPPRQYKRSISDTAREDTTALESRHSFTSVDLNQEESIGDSHKVSLRKSVSLDYGLDNGPAHQRFSSISSEDQTEKSARADNSKAKSPLFRSLLSLFRKSKKPTQETLSIKETQESDGDDESVFHKDFANEVNHSPSSSLEEKTKSKKYQKSVKPEKAAKPEKPPKPAKFLKRQQLESMKRKISLPFLDDSFPEVLNPGLEGRALCRLLKVNEDETRVVEMIRPQTGPLGVFFTKGQEQNDEGLLVNAFQDSRNCKLFAGILGVGDQILEIDGCDIRHLSLDQVGEMMYDKERMIVRVMPASVARSAL